ncbi:unnamed protein product [Lactuca virosa]|uniref:CCHC-type domain-containing protein n=1 Tax=Lactuca virosa TaxID=75947 RepID=A0AAU9M1I7_9ASTR|nr:unnamed protein product [Lactuca virosa]
MDRYVALYSKTPPPNNDNELSDESEGEAVVVKRYIRRSKKKPSGPRRFPSKSDSSTSKGYDARRKIVAEKNEGLKCSNYGGTGHFARECKSKKVDTNEDYEVKYKKLLASLKRKNIDVKVMVAEVESWVDDEESSDEDKGKDKCFMACTDAFIINE